MPRHVSVLFSEPKIPQYARIRSTSPRSPVSVLFSEPKIPQLGDQGLKRRDLRPFQCSSASRKFLNLGGGAWLADRDSGFSALQRAENSSINLCGWRCRLVYGFSALQRAENSSIDRAAARAGALAAFQCSSASRKFLNLALPVCEHCERQRSFSALQRAENSSTV